LRYAQRCGVRASAQALARQAGLVRQLFALSAPDDPVRALAEAKAQGGTGDIAAHFFPFGGLLRSARWAQAATEGRITLENGTGFRVEPPRM
jgi:methylenetetrahydrofolate reductase (NADPH)